MSGLRLGIAAVLAALAHGAFAAVAEGGGKTGNLGPCADRSFRP
jgi:hypothetical protein